MKFSIDGAGKGKLGLAGIGCVLHNGKGDVMMKFSKSIGVKDSNEAEVLAILEALCMFVGVHEESLL